MPKQLVLLAVREIREISAEVTITFNTKEESGL